MRRSIGFLAAVFLCAGLGVQAATVAGTVRATAAAGATGTPIEGAKVVLIKVALGTGGAGGVQTRLDSVQTNAQGEFNFAKVDTGLALLAATKDGYQNGSGFATVAQDTGTYNVNITLRPPPDTTPGTLQGTVRRGNAQGTPLAGATVVVSRTGGGTAQRDTLTTDAQGHFAIPSLAAATYSLRASDTGYQAGVVTATVRPHDTTVADIALLPDNASGSVSGKVAKASDGSAISGAAVIMTTRTGGVGGTARADTVKSGSDGTYKIDSVPAGQTFTLTVKADGFQTMASAGLTVAFEEKRVVDFALIAAVANDTTHGSVAGTVTDTAHKAVAGVRVILSRATAGAAGDSLPPDTVMTNSNGQFEFPSVTARISYRITISMTGFRTSTANVTVSVGQTSTANLTLLPTTAIRPLSAASGGMRLSAGPAGRLILEMPSAPFPGRVRAYDARGVSFFAGSLRAGEARLEIPWVAGKTGYVVVERGGEFHRLAAAAMR